MRARIPGFLLLLFVLVAGSTHASEDPVNGNKILSTLTLLPSPPSLLPSPPSVLPSPPSILPSDSVHNTFRKEKLITAILAFPVPFGFSGLHRIYLGTQPWIPVAYLLTGGGGAGIVPLIDFIFILTANEEEFRKYQNNPNFFMWVE